MLISNDDFLLKGTRLVIPANLRKHVLADLYASHRGIISTKASARLLVYLPGNDNDISSTCESCSKCEFDRPSNVKEPMQHLPVATQAFHIIPGDQFDLNGEKFLVTVGWYSGYFDVKGPIPNPNAASLINCSDIWLIITAACDVLWSDGNPPFGSTLVNDFVHGGASNGASPRLSILRVTLLRSLP